MWIVESKHEIYFSKEKKARYNIEYDIWWYDLKENSASGLWRRIPLDYHCESFIISPHSEGFGVVTAVVASILTSLTLTCWVILVVLLSTNNLHDNAIVYVCELCIYVLSVVINCS